MKTIQLTDMEYELLQRGVMFLNDFEEDTALENVSANLFPTTEQPTVLTRESAAELRQEIDDVYSRREARHNLMRKLGVAYNEKTGYSA